MVDSFSEKIKKLGLELKKKFSLKAILLEGSRVMIGNLKPNSDYDIVLIFDYLSDNDYLNIAEIIKKFNFDDKYFFVPLTYKQFIKKRNSIHDFSNRFKTKLLFGEDIINDKVLPKEDEIKLLLIIGFKKLLLKLNHRYINIYFWSDKNIDYYFYKFIKQFMRHLEVYVYYKTKKFPRSKDEILNYFNNAKIKKIIDLYYLWYDIDKNKKIILIKEIIEFIKDILSGKYAKTVKN